MINNKIKENLILSIRNSLNNTILNNIYLFKNEAIPETIPGVIPEIPLDIQKSSVPVDIQKSSVPEIPLEIPLDIQKSNIPLDIQKSNIPEIPLDIQKSNIPEIPLDIQKSNIPEIPLDIQKSTKSFISSFLSKPTNNIENNKLTIKKSDFLLNNQKDFDFYSNLPFLKNIIQNDKKSITKNDMIDKTYYISDVVHNKFKNIDIENIPRYKDGGIVGKNGPELIMVGDGGTKYNPKPEMILPHKARITDENRVSDRMPIGVPRFNSNKSTPELPENYDRSGTRKDLYNQKELDLGPVFQVSNHILPLLNKFNFMGLPIFETN